ncbi:MAG: MotA/TolQ/ExbB proton channel family protein, partial [Phycisphaerales bacterium]|nr:MotA/TolQ/ExbB proton channel family protein [Phycisphaerales bacterium]
ARLYRWTDGLALIATIAPMLGLLGTVVGINKAFANLHDAANSGASGELASAISLALVTTIMGLVLAIPTTTAVTFFRNRIDSLASDISSIIDDLAVLIEEEPHVATTTRSAPPPGPRAAAPGGQR